MNKKLYSTPTSSDFTVKGAGLRAYAAEEERTTGSRKREQQEKGTVLYYRSSRQIYKIEDDEVEIEAPP